MTVSLTRRLISVLLFLCSMTACGPVLNGSTHAGGTTPTTTTTPVPQPSYTSVVSSPRLAVASVCPAYLKPDPDCLTPQALRAAYGVEPLIEQGYTGKGQTVIDIVSFGAPALRQDVDTFDKQFGLPPVQLQIISPINGPVYDPNNDRAGWGAETELDVEIIHAIAPDAAIVVLTSPVAETEGTVGLPEFLQLEQYALDHHLGNIISQSWGASELTLQDQAGQQELHKWDSFFQQTTTQQGITFFASSGDSGATDYTDLQAKHLASVRTTSFPPDDPWVTAVGGTTLSDSNATYQEMAWNSANGASGGGFSRFFSMPDYQKMLPTSVQSQFQHQRGVPDVAADADPRTGLAVYLAGQWSQAGGTSASAPLWAGLMAIADQMAGRPLGFINPVLYKLALSSAYTRDFYDITTGDNTNHIAHVTGYSAAPGWDPVTGLGTPNAAKLLPDLIALMKS
jgi:subtilase family serine protease